MSKVWFAVLALLVLVTGVTLAGGAQEAETQQPVTITFWYQANVANPNDPWVVWYSSLMQSFTLKYPDIKVNETVVASGDEYLNKISTAMAAGNTPDVFKTWLSGRLEPFVEAGRVLPLNNIIDNSPELKNVLNMQYLDTGTFDGQVYAIPTSLTAEIIFYNRAIFKQLGLSIPQTWDELITMVKAIRSSGVSPFSLGNRSAWRGSIPYMAIFDRLNGPDLYKEVVIQHKAKWDDPAFVKAANYLIRLRDAGAYVENFNALSSDEGDVLFTTGKTPMFFIGTWMVSSLSEALGNDLSFFDFPKIPTPDGTGLRGGSLLNKDNGFAISSDSDHQEQAAVLLKHIFSQEPQKKLAELGDLIACVNIQYDKSKAHPVLADLMSFIAETNYGIIPWDNPLGVNMGKEFNLTTQAILGGADPTTAFQQLQKVALAEWGN